jgi:hypothetical protein
VWRADEAPAGGPLLPARFPPRASVRRRLGQPDFSVDFGGAPVPLCVSGVPVLLGLSVALTRGGFGERARLFKVGLLSGGCPRLPFPTPASTGCFSFFFFFFFFGYLSEGLFL